MAYSYNSVNEAPVESAHAKPRRRRSTFRIDLAAAQDLMRQISCTEGDDDEEEREDAPTITTSSMMLEISDELSLTAATKP